MTAEPARLPGYHIALAGALLASAGGVFDALVPGLLPHHERFLGVAPGAAPAETARLVLLLLHALGAALAALGAACVALLVAWNRGVQAWMGWAAVAALAVGEGVNAAAIARVGSLLYLGPVVCVLAVFAGVAMGERARRGAAAAR